MSVRIKMGKWFSVILWMALGIVIITVMAAAIQRKGNRNCEGVDISITGAKKNLFVGRQDIMDLVIKVTGKNIKGRATKEFDLRKIEEKVESSKWVKNAEIFFDNRNRMQVKVEESEPLARIFTATGNSYYIDETLRQIPLSEKFSAHVPVVTNFPGGEKSWSKKDSVLMEQLKDLSLFIQQDSFWSAQIEQVDIDPERNLVLIPKVGDHLIQFGEAKEFDKKFRRLFIFYKEVLSQTGWNRYALLNVQYQGQVVAVRKDSKEIKADTILARQWLRQMIQNAQQEVSEDTLNRAQQNYGAFKPVKSVNPATPPMKITASEQYEAPGKPGMKEQIPLKPSETKQPKAIMPPVKKS